MYEKRRPFTRVQPKSAHSIITSKSPSYGNALPQQRENIKPVYVNALPSLVPTNSENPFFQLKVSYSDVANSVSQFISHTSSNIPYRAPLTLLMKEVDSLFQNFCTSVSKIIEDSDRLLQHGHTNIKVNSVGTIHQCNSTLNAHRLLNTPQAPPEQSVDDTSVNEIETQNYSASEMKVIKNSTDPFLFAWCKFIKQIISIQSTGFSAIIEGVTSHFNKVIKHVDKLSSLHSKSASIRENSKKTATSLRTKINEIHSSLRKLIPQSKLIQFADNNTGDQPCQLEFNDTQQTHSTIDAKGKQVVNSVHDLSQMFVSAFANDFSSSLSSQELDLCRNDILASLNEIIQGIRSIILFDTDMISLSVSFQKFQKRLQFFVYSNNLRFPTEQELLNNNFLNQSETGEIIKMNDQESIQTQSKEEKGKDVKEQNKKFDDFDENMNMQELIQVGEKNFLKKNLSDYSQLELNTAMLRFFSLLKGKIVDCEEKYRKLSNEHYQNQIKKICQHNENRMKDYETAVKSLNQTIINKNYDIQFLQSNPALDFLQEAVNIIYQESGDLVPPQVDLADPKFMCKLTMKIRGLKNPNQTSSSNISSPNQTPPSNIQNPFKLDSNKNPLSNFQNPLKMDSNQNPLLNFQNPFKMDSNQNPLFKSPLKLDTNPNSPSSLPPPSKFDINQLFLNRNPLKANSNQDECFIKQNLLEILDEDCDCDDLLNLTKRCKEKVSQLKQEQQSNLNEIDKLIKSNKSLKKSLTQVLSLSQEIDLSNIEDETQLNEQITKFQQIYNAKTQIDQNKNEIDQNKNEIDQNKNQIDQNKNQIDQNGNEIGQNGNEIDQNGNEIDQSKNEIDRNTNQSVDEDLKEKINQVFGLTPGQTVDDQLKYIARNRKNETELITKFQSVCHEVEDSLSVYLKVEKSDMPIIESIQHLLKMLNDQ